MKKSWGGAGIPFPKIICELRLPLIVCVGFADPVPGILTSDVPSYSGFDVVWCASAW